MKNVIGEVHRRSLWQVLVIYLAVSWVSLQVVNEIGDAVGFPDWVSAGALILLVIGFPIVIATAFVHEGMRTRAPAPPEQSLADVGEVPAPPAPEPSGARKILTWRRALVGGGVAFLLFGVGTAGWMALRAMGIGAAGSLVAKGAIEERGTVLIADFAADDEDLRRAATQALRVDLSQSNVIRLMAPREVEAALERMGRDADAAVTEDVAREVAEREGVGAIISGEINRAGVGYLFSASVVSGSDGSVLTTQRESASDSTDVIPAIDRLSRKLRERIGESFGSIRSSPPLERVTTSSLEALKLYSRTNDVGRDQRIALLEEALALDPEFAMAWRSLGIIYRNRNTEYAKTVDAFTRGYEARDRLTERERRIMVADYYTLVEFEPARAIAEYEAVLEMDPEDPSATINLGVLYSELGDYDRSIDYALRGIELEPDSWVGYWNSITSLVNADRLDEAQAIVDTGRVRFSDGRAEYASTMVSQGRGDLAATEETFASFLEFGGEADGGRANLAGNLAALRAAGGRLSEAAADIDVALDIWDELGDGAEYLEAVVQAAWVDVAVRRNPEGGLQRLNAALERQPLADLPPLDRPYPRLAEVLARSGDPARAEALLEEMERDVDRAFLGRLRPDIDRAEAEIALAEGRIDEAIELFRRSDAGVCLICALPGMALAYETAGQADSAVAALERYVDTPYSDRFLAYTYPLGPAISTAHERLGELHDEAGNLDDAAKHFARFVELWAEADEELQPRVRAAQARLEEILRKIG